MQNLLVSIVTPSYNQALFIEETILSVMGQDYTNIEHIIVDGGSTDGTINILQQYEDKYNLVWLSEDDDGQADAINKGFQMAKGDIVGWLNSDDTYLQGTISKAVDFLVNNPQIGWVHGDGYFIDKDSNVLGMKKSKPYNVKELISKGLYIVQPSVFVRKDLVKSVGYLDKTLQYTMDTDWFFRLGLKSGVGYIPEVLATRRFHDQAKSVSHSLYFPKDLLKVLDKLFQRPDLPDEIVKIRKIAYSRANLSLGFRFFNVNKNRESRKYIWKSLRVYPNPFRIEAIKSLIVLIESYLKIHWYVPGRRKGRNLIKQGDMMYNVKWSCRKTINND